MTLEQRLIALAQVVRDEFNKLYNGAKSVENSNRVGTKNLATIESDYTTAISNAVTGLLGGVPPAGDTLKKLYDEIQLITGGGYATLADVNNAINNLINGADGTFDTLKEIADVLQNDPNIVTTLTSGLALKANSADVYTITQSDATFKTITSYNAEIGNPDHDLVVEFTTGLL
jgi:hypothetical protein